VQRRAVRGDGMVRGCLFLVNARGLRGAGVADGIMMTVAVHALEALPLQTASWVQQ
jgi:hypothetical protein